MADKKLNFKQISIAWTGATFTTVTTSGTLAALIDGLPILETAGWTWFALVGVPSVIVAGESLSKALGWKKSIGGVTVSNATNKGRAVPINYGNGKKSTVFLSEFKLPSIRNAKQVIEFEAPELPKTFTVHVPSGNTYTVHLDEIDYFIRKSHNRQRAGYKGLSREYWTKKHSPRLMRDDYDARIQLLLQYGLIVDRGERRAGRLLLPPARSIKMLQAP